VSDIAAFLIAAIVALWLGAPLWVWLTLGLLALACALVELGSSG
jgi:hypothetical protein